MGYVAVTKASNVCMFEQFILIVAYLIVFYGLSENVHHRFLVFLASVVMANQSNQ